VERTETRAVTEARTLTADGPLAETRSDTREDDATGRISSFQRLCDEQLDGSYRLARVILGERAEAEDAVHDAVVTAWTKWSSLRDPSRFEAWFGRIVVNTCRNRLKKASRRHERSIENTKAPVAPDTLSSVHERERMSRAFAALEPDHRVVLALRYYRDLPVDEIACLTGVRPGTVKSRLHRAQQRMRQVLTSEESTR
jgi:RNA polymerase sigma-70 factor (ECF subfamily)